MHLLKLVSVNTVLAAKPPQQVLRQAEELTVCAVLPVHAPLASNWVHGLYVHFMRFRYAAHRS